MHGLSQGPDPRACVLNRVHINNWLFRTSATEISLVTQNSGVLVKSENSDMTWYGVIRNIISLEFPHEKEVILFQCDWYDAPTTGTSRSKGYSRDKYGIIDIATSMFSYSDEPYILASNAEPVFYAPIWTSRDGLLLFRSDQEICFPCQKLETTRMHSMWESNK